MWGRYSAGHSMLYQEPIRKQVKGIYVEHSLFFGAALQPLKANEVQLLFLILSVSIWLIGYMVRATAFLLLALLKNPLTLRALIIQC